MSDRDAIHRAFIFLSIFGFFLLFTSVSFAWTNPTANPTGGTGTIVIQSGAPANSLYVKSNGNIGVGNTTAAYKLHVTGSSFFDTATNTTPLVVARTYKTSNFEEARMGVDDGAFQIYYINDEASSAIRFRLQNTDTEAGGGAAASDRTVMSIVSDATSGRVGIGTQSPTTALEVSGTVKATAFEGTSTGTSSAANVSAGAFGANTGGGNYSFPANLGVGIASSSYKLHVYETVNGGYFGVVPGDGGLEVASGNDSFSFIDFKGSANLASDYRGRFGYSDGSGFTFRVGGSATNSMIINESGNVGIGVDSPGARLHLVQSIPSSVTGIYGGTQLVLDSNGNNFINFRNTADNGTYQGLVFADNNNGGYIAFRNYTSSGSYSDSMVFGSYQDFYFQTGSTDTVGDKGTVFTIKQGGSVGIGTVNPVAKLDVRGNIEFGASGVGRIFSDGNWGVIFRADKASPAIAEFMWQNANDTERMRIDTNGRLGIGTTAPGSKLSVIGGAEISRDGTAPCCAASANFTLSLAEGTSSTGKTARIQFHNSGVSEGYIELANGGARRFILDDSQGNRMGLDVTGNLTVVGNSNTCQLVSYSGGTTACPAGYYTWSGQALASGYMLCCKVSNPI